MFLLTGQKKKRGGGALVLFGLSLFVFSILFFALSLPSALGAISIEKFSVEKYNLGDRVFVSGKVNVVQDMIGMIWLSLACGDVEKRIATVVLDLDAGKDAGFSQLIVIPRDMLGTCQVKADLYDGNSTLVESAVFDAFAVVDELSAVFDIVRESYQLGEGFVIRGSVSKQDGTPVNGIADFYFKQNGAVILFEQAEILGGEIDFTRELSLLPAGEYAIDIGVSDVFGNSGSFEGLYKFVISSKMIVDAMLDKGTYSPGDLVVVTGTVRGDVWRSVEGVEVWLIVEEGNVSSTEKVELGSAAGGSEGFSFEKKIASNAKSGKHKILLVAKDADGNKGEVELEYVVRQVPTLLSLSLEKTEFDPEEKVGFVVEVYDQGGDSVLGSVVVKLIDNEGKEVESATVGSHEESSFMLPQSAKPGEWKLVAEGFGFKDERVIVVKEHKELEVGLEGQKLDVTNVGNVKIDDELEIIADGVGKLKRVKLDVGDSKKIDLGKLFDTGVHDVEVPSAGERFDDVDVTESKNWFEKVSGNVAKNLEEPKRKYALLGLGLVILVCLVLLGLHGRRKRKVKEAKEFWSGKKRLKELGKISPAERRTQKMEFGKPGKEDEEDFKRRITKMFEDEERKKERNEFLDQFGGGGRGRKAGNKWGRESTGSKGVWGSALEKSKAGSDESKSGDIPKKGLFNMFG